MRGGRFQQRGNEDANSRDAEALFESRSVGEIREVELLTRKEIQGKKEELKQLVGASYRDLIDSADSILAMKRCCELVTYNIAKMEDGFNSLRGSINWALASSNIDRERKRREILYAIGSRVKYLVDTPEKIWGCLDEHMYLEGAERYLRAREVHSLLWKDEENKECFANFALLKHQWPLVETFRSQISQRSRDSLQDPDLPVRDYGVALASIAIMENLSSIQCFQLFLETRRSWIKTHLREMSKKENPEIKEDEGHEKKTKLNGQKVKLSNPNIVNLANMLGKLVRMIQATLCHAGELFLELSNGTKPLFFQTVLTTSPVSQLFGGIPNPEAEIQLWKSHRKKLEKRMSHLHGNFITEASLDWLRSCAEEIHLEEKSLFRFVSTCGELTEIECLTNEAINSHEAFKDSMIWLRNFGQVLNLPWELLSNLLLKESINLWDFLFESIFVAKAKDIIDANLASITVPKMIDDLFYSPPKLGNKVHSKHLSKGRNSDQNKKEIQGDREWFGGVISYFGQEVNQLKDSTNTALKVIHQDLLSFLQSPCGAKRANELGPYLQEQSFQFMLQIAHRVEASLSSLSECLREASFEQVKDVSKFKDILRNLLKYTDEFEGNHDMEMSVKIERAILLGKVSLALGQCLPALSLILSPINSWDVEGKILPTKTPDKVCILSLSLSRSAAEDKDKVHGITNGKQRNKNCFTETDNRHSRYRELQCRFKRHCIFAHSLWVSWSTRRLVESFKIDLHKDERLASQLSLKGWEETIILQEGGEGEKPVEIKMSLPALPSPYTILFLFLACQEVYHIGGHVLDRIILKLFALNLLEEVLTAYENFLEMPSVPLSEKGLLQLIFDVRFLGDMLSGGHAIPLQVETMFLDGNQHMANDTTNTDGNSSCVLRTRICNLLLCLSGKLDPIDWEIYESYLWENERRSYQRCAVLFGLITLLNRLYTDNVHKIQPGGDSNTLSMSVSVPRFTYLPISLPAVPGNGATQFLSRTNGPYDERSPSSRKSGMDGKITARYEEYSNLALGSQPLFKSLIDQVGSKFGEGTLKFQSMIIDGRLKDKSAVAISTIGDILPVQATGLLSSLTL